MAKVAYYVDDMLGLVCNFLNENFSVAIGGYSLIGDHYAFDSAVAYMDALNAAKTMLNGFYDTDDEDDDKYANEYLPRLVGNSILMYWSTESGSWV